MQRRLLQSVIRYAELSAFKETYRSRSDADLFHAFVANNDECAFAGLVRRHGPMVWGVCQNLLRSEANAEDAFQATFLALVRSKDSIRNPAAIGAWLHRVAIQICQQAKRETYRRVKREKVVAAPETARPGPDHEWRELHERVHREIDKLPEKQKAVFVLCCLGGIRPVDASVQMGMKINTLTRLLSRARQQLLQRLKESGQIAGALTGVAVLSGTSNSFAIPGTLLEKAISFVHSDAATGVSSTVLNLAHAATEVPMVRFKLLAAMLIVGVAMSAGVGGTILSHSYADDPTYAKPQPNPVNGNPYQNPTKNNSKPTPGTVVNNGSPELIEALREWYVDLSPPAEVKSWDYKVVALHDPQTELVKLGREGWELVAIDRVQGTTANSSGPIAYLKKQIPQNPTVAYGSILNSRLNQLQPPSTSQPNGNNTPTVTGSYYDPLNGKATGSETTVNPNSSPKKEVKGSLKVFRLKNGNAKEIAQILRGLFVKEPGFKDAVSEQRTNSLIVHGSDEILKQIEALLQNLDSVKTDDKR